MSGTVTRLTAQQDAAISAREVSVALSAGAGCGKTFVLTQRFLSHLRPGPGQTELHNIVAITFTDRAAREMRERIRAACNAELRGCSLEEVPYWLEVLRGLDTARISTIHSFCAGLLRTHAVEAGIDPRFGLLEQAFGETFLRNVVWESVQRLLSEFNEDCMELVLRYGLERTRDLLRSLVLQRFRIDFRRFEGYTPEALAEEWRTRWNEQCVPLLLNEIVTCPETVQLLRLLQTNVPSHPVMQRRCEFISGQLPRLPETDDRDGLIAELLDCARVQGGGNKSVWPDDDCYELVKEGLKGLREALKKLQVRLKLPDGDVETAARYALIALRLTERIAADYEEAKREASVLDFDDLLLRTRNLLADHPDVCRRAAAGIELLMVDEFQDTDPVQAQIVRCLCGEAFASGRLFLVGDIKQSIYRFRRADPAVFLAMQEEVPEQGRLPLSTNFRSQPEILKFVNCVFAREMGERYEPLSAHDARQLSPTPAIEFLFASAGPDEELEGREMAAELREREATWIARRIRALLQDETPRIRDRNRDTGELELRRVRPGDIVVLFRALSSVQEYEEALREEHLEYYLVGGRAFYAQQEVYDVANLCQFLDDRDDEVSLLGVLRSPMFGLSDDTIFTLRSGASSLRASLELTIPRQLPREQRERAQHAADVLRELRERKDRASLTELLTYAIEQTGYDAALLTEHLGRRKVANLRKLIELAREFDRPGVGTLKDFALRMRESVTEESDEELAATHAEASDVIRLMTIHQSKGLEFPVVILADMNRQGPPKTRPAWFHPELGPLLSMPEIHGEKKDNLGQEIHKVEEEREDQAETLRVLYVALTRAADYLILSAGLQAKRKTTSSWMRLVASLFDLETGLPKQDPYLGSRLAIGNVALEDIPAVRIHREPPAVDAEKSPKSPPHLPLEQFAAAVSEADPVDLPPLFARMARDVSRRWQFTVSELEEVDAVLHDRPAPPPERRKFVAADEDASDVTAAEHLGTLVHEVLERIDFHKPELERLIRACSTTGQIVPDDDLCRIAHARVQSLLESPLARLLAEATQTHRELQFLLRWPPGRRGEDKFTVGGTIDLLLQSADGNWHILDYKTGRAAKDSPDAEILAKYEIQLGLYAWAAKELIGGLPASIELVLLQSDVRRVPFPVSEEGLMALAKRVDAAIERIRFPGAAPIQTALAKPRKARARKQADRTR